MKLLITGANGQLGQALVAACKAHQLDFIATTREEIDICQLPKLADQLAFYQPNIVVNAAAYTAVDKAETAVSDAYLLNEIGAKNLATACEQLGIALIHISTDYVFAGDANTPYSPSDECAPKTVYGASKLAGERAIAAILPAHIIIRTAWLYSQYGNNFAKTMLRLANERDSISVVSDQIGCPTYAPDLAEVILAVAQRLLQPNWQHYGTYHFVGQCTMSWFAFAQHIMAVLSNLSTKAVELIPLTSEQYPTAAKRPKYSVLNCEKLWLDFNISAIATPIDKAIAQIIAKQ